jgi:quinol monooxygenase YgiN
MSKYGLFDKLKVKEGGRDTLVEILLEAAESMENLIECEIYLVNISHDEPNFVFVYEVWSNASAHQDSLSLESTQTLTKRAKPIITEIEKISTILPRRGKAVATIS